MRRYREEGLAKAGGIQTDRQLLERFVRDRDESAFEVLVQRHGPMVLGVCRRLLHDVHDAEDAFQATFLVLVRKAGSIAQPDLLGNWLYGVAFRVATKARANAARRSAHERQAAFMPKPEPNAAPVDRELRAVLDREINHLPEKYRVPLVLCYLEGKTNEEAARQLGCPTGSMSWRLNRGRELLRKRLSRRLAITPLLLPPLLAHHTASAAVPATLLQTTVKAAVVVAAGKATAAGAVSTSVAALTEETLKAMGVISFKLGAAAAVLVFFLLASFSFMPLTCRNSVAPPPSPGLNGEGPGNCSGP
jgi:RNA polymerase sigma factor (sigma-70 family)